jgi:hypothetical protein
MKIHLLALSALVLLAPGIARAENYPFKDVVTRTAAFESNGEFFLENVNGDVDLRAWDKNEISIEAEKSAKTEEELQQIDLKIDLSESKAVIKVKLPKRSGGIMGGGSIRAAVRFKIMVPATVAIEKLSVVNASIKLDGVRGAVHVDTVNGRVNAINLGGSAEIETVNGPIDASFSAVGAQQALSFDTVNGPITVRLPADAGVQLDAGVVNGRIRCDFPRELGSKKGWRSLKGKIGDGRAELDVDTVNGSIRIEKQ